MVYSAGLGPLVEDDFILTISDNESNVPDWDAEAGAISNSIPVSATNDKKRKRNEKSLRSPKNAKKQKHTQNSSTIDKPQNEDQDGSFDSGLDDGAFDPDFEFLAEGGANGMTKHFDGWDLFNLDSVTGGGGKTKAIGIDEIIARRRERTSQAAKETRAMGSTEDAEEDEEEDEEEEGAEEADDVADTREDFSGFTDEDNDLFSKDGFGMGAPAEDEDDQAGESSENADWARKDVDTSEDEDGIAAPVPHPDDALSDSGASLSHDNEIVMTERQRAFFAPDELNTQVNEVSATEKSFQTMSLSRPILKGLASMEFTSPTPIQLKTIPIALLGKDLVGGAVTGSGKTAAFIIPVLERLLYRPRKVRTTRVAILMPTRELAVQCYKVATKLASFTDITFALIVGGLSLREQEQTLRKRPDVVIATPGRFIDHMRNSASFAVENIEILILDEADRMLEDGFADELNEILNTIPSSRQTMLFSATMTQDVDTLVRTGMSRPARLMVDAQKQTVKGLVQEFIKLKGRKGETEEERRLAYLLHLCSNIYTTKTIVFLPQKALAHRVKILFSLKDVKAAELHGSMSQEQRLSAISSFRDGSCTHLLATDLASRGLDIPRVETVINYTVPSSVETYVHRVGRTARAGRDGVACTIFSATKTKSSAKSSVNERTLLRPILRMARTQSATMRTRTIPTESVGQLTGEIRNLKDEIDSVLLEEKEEKLLQQTERDVTKGENLVKYEEEIASRPKRTWFQSEKEKRAASELGKNERLGLISDSAARKEKPKLSGKQKKKLLNRDDRLKGGDQGWKKGREERKGRGVLQQERNSKTKEKKQKDSVKSKKITRR